MNRAAASRTLLSAMLASLAACQMTGTNKGSSVVIPTAWRNAAGFPVAAPDRDIQRWWSGFDDPLMSRVIRESLAGSQDIATAISRVRQAQAQRRAQASVLFPSVDASASRSASRQESDFGNSSGTNYSGGLSASWELDFFGKNRQSVIAASADAGAAQENLHSAESSLAAEVALAYLDLRTIEARLVVVRESVSTRQETFQLTTWRNQAGEIDSLDLSQAESSVEQANASLLSLEQSASQTRNRLSLLAGKTPGSLDSMLAARTGRVPSPARRLAVGIPADTVRQRPDVRAAGYQWVAAVARTRSAEAERLPSLRLSGSLGMDTVTSAKVFNPESLSTGLVAGLTSPVFDAGRIRANIDSQTESQNQALLGYESSVLVALSEVENALIACRLSTQRLATLEKAAVAAREALDLANLRYEAGVTDFITLLDAQRTDLSLQESVVNARADRAAAHVELYRAAGGGWSSPS